MSDMLLDLCVRKGLDANYASSGAELAMPCPLCDDHKPRLYINRSTLKWTCFNCQAAGFAERFLTEVLQYDGIVAGHLKSQLLGDAPIQRSSAPAKPAVEAAEMDWPPFTMPLDSTSDEAQLPYWTYLIKERGLTVEQIVFYRIRYCAIGKYGGRVIVPVYMDGQLRGWVARLIRPAVEGEQKVLTPMGMKSSLILFNLTRTESVVLVEGVFDAMAFPTNMAVATLGAKLSPIQRDLLRRAGVSRVVVMYDNDEAGWKGTRRAASELVAAGFDVEIAMLPEGTDPGGANMLELEQAIARAFPVTGVRSAGSIYSQLKKLIKEVKENTNA